MGEVDLSIITINLNNSLGLQKTIESVIPQKEKSIEYIIIDGASTDGSLEVVNKYRAEIDVLVSEPDTGIYNAMNKGIKLASGSYCMLMNAGDWLIEGAIRSLLERIPSGGDVLYGDARTAFHDKIEDYPLPRIVTPKFFSHSTINHQSCIIKTSLLKAVPYDETYRSLADWSWFLRASLEGKTFIHIGKPIAYFDMYGLYETNKELVESEKRRLLDTALPQSIQNDYRDMTKIMESEWQYWKTIVDKHRIARKIFIVLFKALRKTDHILRHTKN